MAVMVQAKGLQALPQLMDLRVQTTLVVEVVEERVMVVTEAMADLES